MKKTIYILVLLVVAIAICLTVFFATRERTAGDLTFKVNEGKKSYTVSDCDDDAIGELVIPSTYKGKPVTVIGKSAFQACNDITKITIPDSVTSIGDGAFYGCSGLTEITIPDSVTNIGESAFEYCDNLASATMGNGITSIRYMAFHGCTGLTEITIPDSVTTIDSEAFYECTGLTEITIPASVTRIYDSAFECCNNLENVFYGGSENRWNQVVIHEWNENLTSAYVYFRCSGNKVSQTLEVENGDGDDLAVNVVSGDIVKFTAKASGSVLKYRWQTSVDGKTWEDCFYRAKKAIYHLPARTRHDGNYYRCQITDADGNVVYTDTIRTYVVEKTIQSDILQASRFAVEAVNATAGVKVTWNETTGVKGYTVYRSTLSGGEWSEWTEIATDVTETIYMDATAKPNTEVKYTVSSLDGGQTYEESRVLKYLITPTATAVNATAGVKVTWEEVPGAEDYNVYRSTYTDGKWAEWTRIATSVIGTTYMDKSVEPSAEVKYAIRAVSGNYKSSYAGGNSVKYLITPTVTAVNATGGVEVTWNGVPGAENYNVYRSTYTGEKWVEWERIATGVTGTTYTDKTAKPNTEVKYTVRAVSGDQKSSYEGGNAIKTH